MTDFEASTPTLVAQHAEKLTEDFDTIAVDASSTTQAAAEVNAELQEGAAGAAAAANEARSPDTEPTPSPSDKPSNSLSSAVDTTAPEQEAAASTAVDSDAAPEPDVREPSAAAGSTAAAAATDSSINAQPDLVDKPVTAPNGLQQAQQTVEEAEAVTLAGSVAAAKAAFLNSQKSTEKVLSPQTSSSHVYSNGVAANASAAALDYEDEKPVIKVRELREQLSATNIPLTGGSRRQSIDGKEEEKRGPSPILSEHDKVNTANVAELLKTAEYKLVPGVDVVPYEELIKLRLEDGIDVTRKEDYLSATDFSNILGMDKAAFGKLPQWKKLQIKKSKLLF